MIKEENPRMKDIADTEKGEIILPAAVCALIDRLESAGYRADAVGGCIRDFLLGKTPSDFDITTSASPEEIKRIFSDMRTVDTGIAHGTVTVIDDGIPYEITTYRKDGEYADNRHPVSVSFTEKIEDDLCRRDFTVNAMAYSPKRGLTDMFGGSEDLSLRLIRTVGCADERFEEDALRILRALRFAATLDFSIEEKTAAAIRRKTHLLSSISAERIYAEWKKLIAGVGAYRVIKDFFSVIEFVFPELSDGKMPTEEKFSALPEPCRALALFALNSDSIGYISAMKRLRCDNATLNFGTNVLSYAQELVSCPEENIVNLPLMKKREEMTAAVSLAVALGMISPSRKKRISERLLSDKPIFISELDIGGEELKQLGVQGREIGQLLHGLLVSVSEGRVENERTLLLSYARELVASQKS